jgi:hypothetical protein
MESKTQIKEAVTKLVGQKLEPGTLIKAEVFEEMLGISRSTQAFSWLISYIRRGLYEHGIYLSGEGFTKTGAFEIYHPRDNYWITKLSLQRAEHDLEGKQTLMINTKLDGFSELEKRRHENMLREVSMKLAAMQRASDIIDMAKRPSKHKPKNLVVSESVLETEEIPQQSI